MSDLDILIRLRREEAERADAIRQWRANACAGSIREDDLVHELTRDAANEIERLRALCGEPPLQ